MIIVTGPFRSGTSLLTRVLFHAGISVGDRRCFFRASPKNPAGYFQRKDVSELNTSIIQDSGGSLSSLPDLSDTLIKPKLLTAFPNINKKSFSIFLNQQHAALKDPRFCGTLPTWVKSGLLDVSTMKVLVMKRTLNDVIQSGLQHYSVKEYYQNFEAGLKTASQYENLIFNYIENNSISHRVINFDNLVSVDSQLVRQMAEYLELDSDTFQRALVDQLQYGRSTK